MRGRTQQPSLEVGLIDELAQAGMQQHEHILRELFGVGAPAREPQRQTEHARLVPAHQGLEGRQITAACAIEIIVGRRRLHRLLRHGPGLETVLVMSCITPVMAVQGANPGTPDGPDHRAWLKNSRFAVPVAAMYAATNTSTANSVLRSPNTIM